MGTDFGHLFQTGDETREKSDQIDYDYYEQRPEAATELEMHEAVFARRLDRILPRLELLGFTLDAARREYETIINESIESDFVEETEAERPPFLSFDEFCRLACRYKLIDLKDDYVDYDSPDQENLAMGRLADDLEDFSRVPATDYSNTFWSEASFLRAKLCVLSAESMLRVFALNPANADADVVWDFGPLVASGWAEREDFQPNARRTQRILVVTEGASDAKIIKRALRLLKPDVEDFFHFVDVDERHHFWGTGNLVKFGEGLLRIDIQNNVLFLLDNDAEGLDALRKLQQLKMPRNMLSTQLPDLEQLSNFAARGPEGVNACDINGKAASIECYLDLRLPNYPPPQVIWSNYKKDVDAWQGALEHKESYQRYFFEQSDTQIRDGTYDVSKLSKLLDSMIAEATRLTRRWD